MTQGLEQAAAPSRARVLATLRGSSHRYGVLELAAATGLSPTAVRFHLGNLIDQGVVRATTDPTHVGPGRPSKVYTALPAEAIESAASYEFLAGVLARELARPGRSRSAVHAGRAWASELLPGVAGRLEEGLGDLPTAVALITQLFDDAGFGPQVGSDGATVQLHSCPFRDLATRHPDVVCNVHLGLVQGLLAGLRLTVSAELEPELSNPRPCIVRLRQELNEPEDRDAPADKE